MLHQNLPIFKVSYDLCVETSRNIKTFPKEYKFNIGQKLFENSLDLMELIFLANSDKSKRLLYLKKLQLILHKLTVLFRLSNELKLISVEKFSKTVLDIDSIQKQLNGWKKTTRKEMQAEQD